MLHAVLWVRARILIKRTRSLTEDAQQKKKELKKKINTELSSSDTTSYLPAIGSVEFPNRKVY